MALYKWPLKSMYKVSYFKTYYKYEKLFSKVEIILKFSFNCICKSSILRQHKEKIGIGIIFLNHFFTYLEIFC